MSNAQKREIKRPIGLCILSICIFLRFGVFQFIIDFNAIREGGSETPLLVALILIGRNVFVAGAAIWAFTGENFGRIALLTIVSLNVLWTLFNVITFVSYSEDQNLAPILSNLLNPIFWLVICWWYLSSGKVLEYYKQDD